MRQDKSKEKCVSRLGPLGLPGSKGSKGFQGHRGLPGAQVSFDGHTLKTFFWGSNSSDDLYAS